MPAPVEQARRRLALLIASSDYSDPSLRQLRSPGRDARELEEVLGDPRIGGFDVQVLINATSGEVHEGIVEFTSDLRPDDQLLIYLSCHGVLDDNGRLYYATVNTRRRLVTATAVAAAWLNERLEDCRSRRQILVLDCCHSGAFARSAKGTADLALQHRFEPRGRGRVVLTASRSTEYSFEGDELAGEGVPSVFTQTVVYGLRSGDADRNKDGLITVTDLYQYVYDKVRAAEPRQTPELWTYGGEGDLLVAYGVRGAVIEPRPLPADLRVTLESPRPRVRETAVVELAELLDTAEAGVAVTARQALQQVAGGDLPQVAALARAALDAAPGAAADHVAGRLAERVHQDQQARSPEPEILQAKDLPTAGVEPPRPQPGHQAAEPRTGTAKTSSIGTAGKDDDTPAGPVSGEGARPVDSQQGPAGEGAVRRPGWLSDASLRAAGWAVLGFLLVTLALAHVVIPPSVVISRALWWIMLATAIIGLLIAVFERPLKRLDTVAHIGNFAWFIVLAPLILIAQAAGNGYENNYLQPGKQQLVIWLLIGAVGNATYTAFASVRAARGVRGATNIVPLIATGLIVISFALLAQDAYKGSFTYFSYSGINSWTSAAWPTSVLFGASLASLLASVVMRAARSRPSSEGKGVPDGPAPSEAPRLAGSQQELADNSTTGRLGWPPDASSLRAAGYTALGFLLFILALEPFVDLLWPSGTVLAQEILAVAILGVLIAVPERRFYRFDAFVHGWLFTWFVILALFIFAVTSKDPFVVLLLAGVVGNAVCAAFGSIRAFRLGRKACNVIPLIAIGLVAIGFAVLALAEATPHIGLYRGGASVLFAASFTSILAS
jgi:hypothetical protein